jgi:diaminopimelate epimerase
MSTLANHAFVKMNGLGNEIVVVDMRGQAGAITADEARAAAQPDGAPYDQLMALHTARTPGTDAYVRIYNSDGSEAGACGNGMRCIAELLFKETGKPTLTFETKAGLLDCWKDDAPGRSTVDMGAPRFAWHEIPLAAAVDDTRAIDLQIGPAGKPILRAPSVVSSGRRWSTIRSFPRGRIFHWRRWRRASTSCCAPGSAAPVLPGRADRPPARRRSPRRVSIAPAAW